jgi:hypothetical protein
MRFRMLILGAAVLAVASLGFGQSQWMFYWGDFAGGSPAWFPMLYDCENEQSVDNPVLEDGTVVRVMRGGTTGGYLPTHLPYVWGNNGALRQIDNWSSDPTLYGQPVEFTFNSGEMEGASEGSFFSPQLLFRRTTPINQHMYLQVGCWNDEQAEFTCIYYSRQFFIPVGLSYVKLTDAYTYWDEDELIWVAVPSDWNCRPEGDCIPLANASATPSMNAATITEYALHDFRPPLRRFRRIKSPIRFVFLSPRCHRLHFREKDGAVEIITHAVGTQYIVSVLCLP